MDIEKKLSEMGLELPPPTPAMGSYVSAVQVGSLLFLSGHGPMMPDGTVMMKGKLGREVTVEQGYEVAKQGGLNLLSTVKTHLGALDRVKRVVKLLTMVKWEPGV